MKRIYHLNIVLSILTLILTSGNSFSQLNSGVYNQSFNIVSDKFENKIKGYYYEENGYDEATKNPRFSCGFYFITTESSNNEYKIKTFWPGENLGDTILGQIIILDSNNFMIKLETEHGGCWNVNHFADSLRKYELDQVKNWIDIKYVTKEKINFYETPDENKRRKAFLLKKDIVYVEKKEGNWLYCIYYGEKSNTKGWLKVDDLNK